MGPIEIQMLLGTIFRFAITVVGAICLTTIIAMALRRRTPPKLESPEMMRRLDEIADRVARLDNAVDAVAVEVERISEGQRFTTRLLTEHSNGRLTPDRSNIGGSTTPH